MQITRKWQMPNSRTFQIPVIRNLIIKYSRKCEIILDPFANEAKIAKFMGNKKYISNDLVPDYNTEYNLESQDFMKLFEDSSIDLILYDPPYSGRQVSECYKKIGKTVNMEDTNSSYWTKFKKEISRILKPNAIVISFGWNSNGIGKKYHFKILEVLLVPHGGGHYDTIVTVEKKIQKTLC